MSDRSALKRANKTAEQGQKIQDRIDALDRNNTKKPKKQSAVQAGQREYPDKLDPIHLDKPGLEADLATAPMYEAPDYLGSEKLKDMVALISGGDSGIGRAVVFAREGADIAISYLTETEDALRTKTAVENEGRECLLLPGDVSDP